MILSINGAETDSMTIPEVLAQLVNVDVVCDYKTKTYGVITFLKVELEVQQVSGGTVTLPADVLNGGGLSGSREGSKTDSKSSKSEKSKKKSKEKRRSSSEDYYHKNHHSNNRDKSNDRRYHSKYNSKYDSRYDDSKYNDPYVSQKSTHV